VHSICQDDFKGAMDSIVAIISEKLGAVCLPRPFVRDSNGVVGCNVVWELPPPERMVAGTPMRCDELPFLKTPAGGRSTVSRDGGAVCTVAQLAVKPDAAAPGGMRAMPTVSDGITFDQGWYYDDFSPERMTSCQRSGALSGLQRVAFTAQASPPTGVTVKLECLNETQSLAQNRVDILTSTKQPKIGDPCGQSGAAGAGAAANDDEACAVRLAAPNATWTDGIDRSMFCHPKRNVCVQTCTTSSECPAAWVCDDRAETLVETAEPGVRDNGSPYCVNPTCGGSND
jgi:hypothetical protein